MPPKPPGERPPRPGLARATAASGRRPASGGCGRQRRGEALERGNRRGVDPTIDSGGAKVALERLDDELGGAVDEPGRLDGIAIVAQQRLQLGKLRAGGADADTRLGLDQRGRLDPMADARGSEPPPGKL